MFAALQVVLEEGGLFARLRYLRLQLLPVHRVLVREPLAQMQPLEARQILHHPGDVVEFGALSRGDRFVVEHGGDAFGGRFAVKLHPAFGEVAGQSLFLLFAVDLFVWDGQTMDFFAISSGIRQ